MFNDEIPHVYKLRRDQVPDVPAPCSYADALRWCVTVMDHDDDDLRFTASLLVHAIAPGLTEKQMRYAKRIADRVRLAWVNGSLACQQFEDAVGTAKIDLSGVEPAGRA